MEKKRFTFFAERPVGDEVSPLLPDGNQLVVVHFVVTVIYVEYCFELVWPVFTGHFFYVIAGDDLTLQNGQMNEYMLGPTEKALYSRES